MDYFQYFDLKSSFNLDLNELRKRYYQKSKELHPDLQLNQDIQLENSDYLTALNNQAYQILLDPLSRLKYLIEFINGPIQEQQHVLSQDFLMEMLELHERIFEAKENHNLLEIENLSIQLIALERLALQESQESFIAFDQGNRSKLILDALILYYFRLKYFRRLRQTLDGNSVEP